MISKPLNPLRRTLLRGAFAAVPAATVLASGCATLIRPQTDEIVELGAFEVIEKIRDGDLSAEFYVTALCHRIAVHPSLNVFTWHDEQRALQSARAIDLERKSGRQLGNIAGLPLVVKDNIDTLGFPTSAGTTSLKRNFPRANAPVVETLFSQGAVLLGKTNMHELAVGGTSSNPTFGFVRNPYDETRVPGGSSGGTAVAIASRMAPAGLGTDTAGSVRIPASFCGIAALRPTTAGKPIYSLDGVVPLVLDLDTIGPMARTVRDVALLNAAITRKPMPSPARLDGLRLGIPHEDYWSDLEPAVLDALKERTRHLKERGVIFEKVDFKNIETRALSIYSTLYAGGFGKDLENYLSERKLGVTLQQLIAQILSRDVKGRFESMSKPPSLEVLSQIRTQGIPSLIREYQNIFTAHGIQAIAFPTEPLVAPSILEGGDRNDAVIEINGKAVNRTLAIVRNTRASGGIGCPGISVPVGLAVNGMPVGLELDGLPQSDVQLLSIGMGIEMALGRMPAPRFNA